MKKAEIQPEKSSSKNPKIVKTKSHPFWRWFWVTFLIISLAYAWYSFYVPSNNVDWADNIVTARKLASDSDKNMMLFFTGEWCVPCRIMKREVFADKEVMEIINSQVVPLMIDFDDPNAEELLKLYKVGVTPVLIFTNPQGKVLDYAVGKIGKTKFLEMVENIGKSGS